MYIFMIQTYLQGIKSSLCPNVSFHLIILLEYNPCEGGPIVLFHNDFSLGSKRSEQRISANKL